MNKVDSISDQAGTYILLAKCSLSQQIQIGKCGMLSLQPGWYVYVGSAFGPGGLAARVGRHLLSDKKQSWHIDYLRAHVAIQQVWTRGHPDRLEHEWASYFLRQDYVVPLPKFGASDCQCASHLFYNVEQPDWDVFCRSPIGHESICYMV